MHVHYIHLQRKTLLIVILEFVLSIFIPDAVIKAKKWRAKYSEIHYIFQLTYADNIICNEIFYIKLEKGKIVFSLVPSTIKTFI